VIHWFAIPNAYPSMESPMRAVVSCWLTAVLGTAACFYGVLRIPALYAEARIQPFSLEQTISMSYPAGGALRLAREASVARRSVE
jgi:hypothetical protein